MCKFRNVFMFFLFYIWNMIRIVYIALISFTLIQVTSCKSKQQGDVQSTKRVSKKIAYYNKKYGLQLNKKSNLELYAMVEDWLGVPHKDNGCEKSGTDCSCFVKLVYKQVYNQDVGKHSQEMYAKTKRITKEQLDEGDLVFFKTKGDKISHVGIYLNAKKFVHVSSSKGVAVNSLEEKYYLNTYTGAGKRP